MTPEQACKLVAGAAAGVRQGCLPFDVLIDWELRGEEAWRLCRDAALLIRLLASSNRPLGIAAAAMIARSVLPLVPADEPRPLHAVLAAEAWLRHPTEENRVAAAAAGEAAAHSDLFSDRAAYAAANAAAAVAKSVASDGFAVGTVARHATEAAAYAASARAGARAARAQRAARDAADAGGVTARANRAARAAREAEEAYDKAVEASELAADAAHAALIRDAVDHEGRTLFPAPTVVELVEAAGRQTP